MLKITLNECYHRIVVIRVSHHKNSKLNLKDCIAHYKKLGLAEEMLDSVGHLF